MRSSTAVCALGFALLVVPPPTEATPTPSDPTIARYGGDQCGVSVASPYKLKHEQQATADGTATTHFYTAKVHGTSFRLFCVRDASIPGPSDDLYATYRLGFLDDDPKELVSERIVNLNDDTVGREVHGAQPDGTHNRVRVFIVPGRAFGVVVSGSQEAVLSEEASRFLESLHFEP